MKTRTLIIFLSLFVICACSKAPEEKGIGYLTLNIHQSTSVKSNVEINDLFLRIIEGRAELLNGRIGDLPAEIALPAGTYTVEAYSKEFSDPKFETPLYSGKTTVDVEAGKISEASLVCSQGNAGIKVVWSGDFAKLFHSYAAQIVCNEGYLYYSSEEERTGYFLPGTVSVSILADGQTINGGTIALAARDMVTTYLKPKYEETPAGGMTIDITIDETVNEREVEIIVDPDQTGNQNSENSETNPYSIAEALVKQGESGVWITGFIVGAKPSSDYDFTNAAKWQDTNIVLADNVTETNDAKVIFVSLTSLSTTQRNKLNLIASPDNLHKRITVKGNLTTYFSRAGLMNPSGAIIQ